MIRTLALIAMLATLSTGCTSLPVSAPEAAITHGYADNNGVKIHYAEAGG